MKRIANVLNGDPPAGQRSRRPISQPPNALTGVAPKCPRCRDLGFLHMDRPLGHPDFNRYVRCPCKSAEDIRNLHRISGLTEEEQKLRLIDIETDGRPGTASILQACIEFRKKPIGILTLWGGVGNAKTMALQATSNELILEGVPAVYLTTFDLISHIRSAFNPQREVLHEDAHQRLRRFENIQVLVLDEFDKLHVTDWVLEILTDLIEKRYRLGLSGKAGTLIAMNSDPVEQPPWVASRLLDGRNRVVHNPDRDIRPAMR